MQSTFAVGKGFRVGPLLDVHGSLQLLNSSHVRERDKALLRSVVVGCVWNGFLLGRVRGESETFRVYLADPASQGGISI